MKAVVKTMYQGDTKVVCLTTRLSTAAEMLHITNKLEDQQETGGVFGDLRDHLTSYLDGKGMYFSMSTEMFLGRNDVIFELLLAIEQRRGEDEYEPYSEEVLGYTLRKLNDHFEWERICSNNYLDSDILELTIIQQ